MANKKKPLKKQKIRNSEYYDMQLVFDELYAESAAGHQFHNLVELIKRPENIKLAYRNMRKNDGSRTAGVDGKTISDLTDFSKKNLDRQMTLINHRFKKALGEHAKHYLPTGAHKSQPRSLDFTRVTFRLPPALENLSSPSGK